MRSAARLALARLVVPCALALATSDARADVLPPDASSSSSSSSSSSTSSSGGSDCGSAQSTAPCDGKKVGDACTVSGGAAGTCTALRCVTDGGQTMVACLQSSSAPPKSESSSGSGCIVAALGAPAGAPLAVGLGLAASLLSRRRRARRR
jgi:hypothetical protein